MQLTPRQIEAVSLCPDHAKQRLIEQYDNENRMGEQKKEILAGVVAAWEAAKRGEEHPRLNQMHIRTRRKHTAMYAYQASFFPVRPTIIVTQPSDPSKMHSDYTDRRFGLGGAIRQE